MFRRLTQFYNDSSTFPPFRVNDEAEAPDTFDRMKSVFLKAGGKKIIGKMAADPHLEQEG